MEMLLDVFEAYWAVLDYVTDSERDEIDRRTDRTEYKDMPAVLVDIIDEFGYAVVEPVEGTSYYRRKDKYEE